ncbi:MAG: GNAT family N-acetyltransferase [Oscillospiraceae bacterium]|nr:GNAT family N-acetyltransferase [Oscillospiraceae bacterium]
MKCTNQYLIDVLIKNKKDYIYIYDIAALKQCYKYFPFKVIECGVNATEEDFYILYKDIYADGYSLTISSYDNIFIDNTLRHLSNAYNIFDSQKGFKVSTNNKSLFENFDLLKKCNKNNNIQTAKILMYNNNTEIFFNKDKNVKYKKLLIDDADIVDEYMKNNKVQNDGNTLEYYFDCCVVHPELKYGDVHIMEINHLIIGYITCTNVHDNIWDVMYVYVNEEERNKSYGSKIINYYANYIVNSNGIPYYSNPVNIYSEKAANSAGFYLVNTHYTK